MAWAPDYCTSAELKAYVRVNDAVDDTQIANAITAASRAVDKTCGRQFGQLAAPAEWMYTARWDRRLCRYVVPIEDLQTTTGLVVKVSGTAVTGYSLHPVNAVNKGLAWTEIVLGSGDGVETFDAITITASWGWSAVPTPVKVATMLQANRFLNRRDSPYGIAGSVDVGSELRLLAQLDPDVRVMVGKYIRQWGAV